MSDAANDKAEQLVDKLAGDNDPAVSENIDRQFEGKLAKLEADRDASRQMLDQLRVLWKMFRAPDDQVSLKRKALIMAALGYFIAPVDMIPDLVGKAGYMDDKMIVAIVYRRLGDAVTAFES